MGDSAYILKNNQPEEGCPVHQHAWPGEPDDPDLPEDPDDPPGDGGEGGDWFSNLWGNG